MIHQLFDRKKAQRNPLNQDQLGILIFIAAFVFGSWFRLFPVYLAGFPINDGGLFYAMTKAIQANGFHIPEFVSYNGLEIPFAYPPFGFYIAGMASSIFKIDLLQVFQYLPAIVLIFSLFAFFGLSSKLLGSKFKAGVATMIFSLLPRSITWLIMGGGITRSFGQLFLILTVLNIHKLFTHKSWKYLLPSILFGSFVCLSHPEAALHTVGIAMLIAIFTVRTKTGLLKTVAVPGGILILTSVWWLPVVAHFGLAPYLSAVQTGLHSTNALLNLFISFSEEPFLTIIPVLALIGIARQIAKQDFLIPSLYVLPFIIEPRNAPNVAAIPMAILSGIALTEVIFPALEKTENAGGKKSRTFPFHTLSSRLLSVYLFATMVLGMLYYDINLANNKLSIKNQQAFEWISKNTSLDSRFLVLTGNTDLVWDWTIEWFPVLTGRISNTTIQGTEWVDGSQFLPRVYKIQALQNCLLTSPSLPCIDDKADQLDTSFDYIFIEKKSSQINSTETARGDLLILELIKENKSYKIEYQSEDVVVFKKLHATSK